MLSRMTLSIIAPRIMPLSTTAFNTYNTEHKGTKHSNILHNNTQHSDIQSNGINQNSKNVCHILAQNAEI
jgi:hypothetical protein